MINNIKVSQFIGSRGQEVKNQFLITTPDSVAFQSYKSIIAVKQAGKVTLDAQYWDYSTTTGKYRNQFLNEDKATTQKKIDSGEYILANLN